MLTFYPNNHIFQTSVVKIDISNYIFRYVNTFSIVTLFTLYTQKTHHKPINTA